MHLSLLSRGLILGAALSALTAPAGPAHATRIEGAIASQGGGTIEQPSTIGLYRFSHESLSWQSAGETELRDGRFAFSEIEPPSTPQPDFYWVSPRYPGSGDTMYPGELVEVSSGERGQTKTVTLPLYERTDARVPVAEGGMVILIRPEEAGVFRVEQQFSLRNTQPAVIERSPGEGPPVARVALAPGAGELRTTARPFLPFEARADGDVLELYGPIFPGETLVQIGYTLIGSLGQLETEIVLPEAVGQLRLLLPPAGFATDVSGLYPGPMDRNQQGNLTHQTFVGYGLPAGARIPISLEARRAAPPLTSAAIAGILFVTLGLAFLVLQPAFSGRKLGAPAAPDTSSPEADGLISALADLEEDHAMGKVSTADRDRMREELRQEALRTLELQRRARGSVESAPATGSAAALPAGAEPPASAERFCSGCGNEHRPGARFCSACGRAIA